MPLYYNFDLEYYFWGCRIGHPTGQDLPLAYLNRVMKTSDWSKPCYLWLISQSGISLEHGAVMDFLIVSITYLGVTSMLLQLTK